jgi:hypothetical protein
MNVRELGARSMLVRLTQRSVAISLALGCIACVLAAALERTLAPVGAVDRALVRGAFGVLLPLIGYALTSRALRGESIDALLRPIARHGASARAAWDGAAGALLVAMAAVGMMLAVATVLTTRTLTDPELAADLARSGWIGACAGVAYGAWLLLGSSFGRSGSGRKWALLLDLTLGSSGSSLAALCPRPHVENLLGGEALQGQGSREATFLLVASTLLALLVARARTAD